MGIDDDFLGYPALSKSFCIHNNLHLTRYSMRQERYGEGFCDKKTIFVLYRHQDIQSIKMETQMRLCNVLNCNLSEWLEYNPDQKNEE